MKKQTQGPPTWTWSVNVDDDFAESYRNMTETPSSSTSSGSSGYSHRIGGKISKWSKRRGNKVIGAIRKVFKIFRMESCITWKIHKQQVDERASHENIFTIDLRGQSVKHGMEILKVRLLLGAYGAVQVFRVIMGTEKIKISVVNLLEKENIEWKEENRETLVIKLNGQTKFGFLDDSGSDSE